MALVTSSDLSTFGITGSTALLTQLAGFADRGIKEYTGRDLEACTYPGCVTNGQGDSGYYSGNDSHRLLTRQRPITAVTALYLDATGLFGKNPDGAFASSTLLTEGVDYVVSYDGYMPGSPGAACSFAGIIERIGGVWPGRTRFTLGRIPAQRVPAQGNIYIQYAAGWSTVPPDLVEAGCLFVAKLKQAAKKGNPLASESLGAYSYSMASAALNSLPEFGTIRQALSKYKEVPI